MADKIPSNIDELVSMFGENTVYELAMMQFNMTKREEDLPGKIPMVSAEDEAARIQEIADKYRICPKPKTDERGAIEHFITWLYKEGCSVADEEDLVSLRTVLKYHVPKYLEERG